MAILSFQNISPPEFKLGALVSLPNHESGRFLAHQRKTERKGERKADGMEKIWPQKFWARI